MLIILFDFLNSLIYKFIILLMLLMLLLGIGDWGLGPIPNPKSPIPNNINNII